MARALAQRVGSGLACLSNCYGNVSPSCATCRQKRSIQEAWYNSCNPDTDTAINAVPSQYLVANM